MGTEKSKIVEETQRLLDDASKYSKFRKIKNPYGEGDAADKIIAILSEILEHSNPR